MAIDWTDAAIEAAMRAYTDAANWPHTMRAALNAAVEAQGMSMIGNLAYAFESGKISEREASHAKGRAEAFEEAAKAAEEEVADFSDDAMIEAAYIHADDIAVAIRKLAQKDAKVRGEMMTDWQPIEKKDLENG